MSNAKVDSAPRVMSGADVLVKSLVDHGVDVLFAYPGGCSMPMHQALTRFGDSIRTILPRHEQGGAFAAQGYACLLYTSPSPRDRTRSRMPSSA